MIQWAARQHVGLIIRYYYGEPRFTKFHGCGCKSGPPSAASTSTPSTSTSNSNEAAEAKFMEQVRQRLDSGDYKVAEKRVVKSRKRSYGWDTYFAVYAGDLDVGVAQCKRCKALYMSKHGTTNMLKHLPNCAPVLEDRLAEFCATSMCSLEVASGEPMTKLLQAALDMGHALPGPVDVKRDAMPHAETVRRHMCAMADREREVITVRARKAAVDKGLAATTDMWLETHRQFNYIAVTLHFNTDFKQESHKFFTTKFPVTKKKTGENIRAVLFEEFQRFGFTEAEFNNNEWVTDEGANMKKGLEGLSREDCLAHQLNTVLKHTLILSHVELREKANVMDTPAEEELQVYLEAAKVVKQKLGASKADKLLKEKVKSPLPHIASYGPCLLSVITNRSKVAKIPDSKGRPDLAERIKEPSEEVQSIVEFLNPLDKTGDVTGPELSKLHKHLEIQGSDSATVRLMKERLSNERQLIGLLQGVKQVKEIIVHLKASGKMHELTKSIPTDSATRWNWLRHTLKIISMHDQVRTVLGETASNEKMSHINLDQLTKLVELLAPFEQETDKLQGQEYPTLPLAVLAICRLRAHVMPKPEDDPTLAVVRARAAVWVAAKLQPSMKHKMALFLHPRFRHLKMLDEAEQNEVGKRWLFNAVRAELRKMAGDEAGAEELLAAREDDPPPAKRRALDDDYVDQWEWATDDLPTVITDEVTKYLHQTPLPAVPLEGLNQFWKSQSQSSGNGAFPFLARLAHRLLGMPATSAPCERLFSDAGWVVQARRSMLAPNTVDSIIFLHSFLTNK
ncbi:Transposable element Hobo transposase [Frankliniella fusca]|uniref:Transposable element Hobo transposase n=1 Tax=Frankliniella fusca TaxID=407009 RepID=A0AAE1HYZ3_9NEOP|nr:Transposable element Hobo transposase [Frankliniella fusca]